MWGGDGQGWWPNGKNSDSGWRLDIVSLLAVIGESSMAEQSQALTASWLCCLPRIIPAPQVLLKPTRPTRMPHTNATVVGVKNGIIVQTLNYFPNIIHPIEDLSPFTFKVYRIKHSHQAPGENPSTDLNEKSSKGSSLLPMHVEKGASSSVEAQQGIRRRATLKERVSGAVTGGASDKLPPHVPAKITSPLNLLSIFSCVLTCGLFGLSVYDEDGIACLALITISMVSSIVGYASLWSPQLMKRTSGANVPPGDVVIRTREGAFIVVHCDENVARELYTGTEECTYTVGNIRIYRTLVGIATFLLMISVVLLGNCNFNEQAAIGAAYMVLNGLYWVASLVPKRKFWNMKLYDCEDVTPSDCKDAENTQNADDPEGKASFTRTMWYAIRQTGEVGWVRSSNAAPNTKEWDDWLKEAQEKVDAGEEVARNWKAVAAKDKTIGQTETTLTHLAASSEINGIKISGGQHVPAATVPPNDR
jgi:hypothetical protein